ncbi:glycosyltransferase [archaeon]|nr:MAG: glycosyltransferase [archaeon]
MLGSRTRNRAHRLLTSSQRALQAAQFTKLLETAASAEAGGARALATHTLIIGVHAYRSGVVIRRTSERLGVCALPFVLVLGGLFVHGGDVRGRAALATSLHAALAPAHSTQPPCRGLPPHTAGTDMNEQLHGGGEDKLATIAWSLRHALRIVAFTDDLLHAAKAACARFGISTLTAAPAAAPKLLRIPQAVDVSSVDDARFARAWPALLARLRLPPHARIFLLPCGLRPVKAPTLLFDAFTQWCVRVEGGHDIRLLVVGPALDADTADAVRRRAHCIRDPLADPTDAAAWDADAPAATSRIVYCDPVPHGELLQWTRHATAVLNTSVSEGQSNALLEAMALGTLVIARDNAGNSAIVKDGHTGLLFNKPEEAIAHCALAARAAALPAVTPSSVAALEGSSWASSAGSALSEASAHDAGGAATPTAAAAVGTAAAVRVRRLTDAAREYVHAAHSAAAEAAAWTQLLHGLAQEELRAT